MAYSCDQLTALREQLLSLRQHALDVERFAEDEIALAHPSHRSAARNLVDYLALRQRDISSLQRELQRNGLSSLGVIQGHVMATIDAVLGVLDTLTGETRTLLDQADHPTFEGALAALRMFADDTLGPCPDGGTVRVMVTMPSEAAADPTVIDDLLCQGMSIMRVNCAHDGPEAWSSMIEHLRRAEQKHGRVCRVSFDLAGPKLRTGPVAPGPEVLRFKPARDRLGRVAALGMIVFGPIADADEDDVTLVPLNPHFHQRAQPGDVLRLDDARGRRRDLLVDNVGRHSLLCTTDRTVYLTTGTPIWSPVTC
jgi:pyruvate kinase